MLAMCAVILFIMDLHSLLKIRSLQTEDDLPN